MLKKILAGSLFLFCNMAFADIIPLSDCSQLQAEKTVVLVHAQWCPPCQDFLPKYIAASNKPEFSDWKFYHVVDDDFHAVCGVSIEAVPTTYKNNMKTSLVGDVPESVLEAFLKGGQSVKATVNVCKSTDKK